MTTHDTFTAILVPQRRDSHQENKKRPTRDNEGEMGQTKPKSEISNSGFGNLEQQAEGCHMERQGVDFSSCQSQEGRILLQDWNQ